MHTKQTGGVRLTPPRVAGRTEGRPQPFAEQALAAGGAAAGQSGSEPRAGRVYVALETALNRSDLAVQPPTATIHAQGSFD